MNGQFLYDSLDPNDPAVVGAVLRAAMLELALPEGWHDLEVDSTYLGSPRTSIHD